MEWGLVQGTVTALAWRGARSRPARVREDSGWRLPVAPTTGVATEPTNARQSSGTPGRHRQTQRPPSPQRHLSLWLRGQLLFLFLWWGSVQASPAAGPHLRELSVWGSPGPSRLMSPSQQRSLRGGPCAVAGL